MHTITPEYRSIVTVVPHSGLRARTAAGTSGTELISVPKPVPFAPQGTSRETELGSTPSWKTPGG
eukprot:285043-Hanusia_phi.AAC.1